MTDPLIQQFLENAESGGQKFHAAYLFGSRARGTERPDSDYDLLLVVREEFSLAEKDALYEQVMDILLETGRLISLKIFRQSEFQRLRGLHTPFLSRVLEEGVKVG